MVNVIPTSYGLPEHPLFRFNRECSDCTLSCKNAVGGSGPLDLNLVKLIIISDHPGYYEKMRGFNFVNNQVKIKGQTDDKKSEWLNAGALIRLCLVNMFGLNTYNDCYMTNVIKCEPGKNNITASHLKICSKYIKEELATLDLYCPTAPILIAGNKAFKSLKELVPDLISSNYALQDCRRRQGLYYKAHPLVFTVNPAAVCKSTFRIETEVYRYDDLIYIPTKKDYPILVGSPVWMFCKDLELISKYL